MKKHVCALINDDKVFIPIATEAFKAVDLDNNNCIDKEEFKQCSYQVAKGFGIEDPSDDAIEEIANIAIKQKTGRGFISPALRLFCFLVNRQCRHPCS